MRKIKIMVSEVITETGNINVSSTDEFDDFELIQVASLFAAKVVKNSRLTVNQVCKTLAILAEGYLEAIKNE